MGIKLNNISGKNSGGALGIYNYVKLDGSRYIDMNNNVLKDLVFAASTSGTSLATFNFPLVPTIYNYFPILTYSWSGGSSRYDFDIDILGVTTVDRLHQYANVNSDTDRNRLKAVMDYQSDVKLTYIFQIYEGTNGNNLSITYNKTVLYDKITPTSYTINNIITTSNATITLANPSQTETEIRGNLAQEGTTFTTNIPRVPWANLSSTANYSGWGLYITTLNMSSITTEDAVRILIDSSKFDVDLGTNASNSTGNDNEWDLSHNVRIWNFTTETWTTLFKVTARDYTPSLTSANDSHYIDVLLKDYKDATHKMYYLLDAGEQELQDDDDWSDQSARKITAINISASYSYPRKLIE